jgi:hypothetical protein
VWLKPIIIPYANEYPFVVRIAMCSSNYSSLPVVPDREKTDWDKKLAMAFDVDNKHSWMPWCRLLAMQSATNSTLQSISDLNKDVWYSDELNTIEHITSIDGMFNISASRNASVWTNNGVSAEKRSRLINWMAALVKKLRYNVKTFETAVAFIDRYISCIKSPCTISFELVACSCISIAGKCIEYHVADIFTFSENFNESDISMCEIDVIRALNWNTLYPPTEQYITILCNKFRLPRSYATKASATVILMIPHIEWYTHSVRVWATAALCLTTRQDGICISEDIFEQESNCNKQELLFAEKQLADVVSKGYGNTKFEDDTYNLVRGELRL